MVMAMAMNKSNVGRGIRLMSTSVWWKTMEPTPKDTILGVTESFLVVKDPIKVNVGVDAYRDDQGNPMVVDCVRGDKRHILGRENIYVREYLPVGGSVKMVEESIKLAYGENADVLKDKDVASSQSLSSTNTCRLFMGFK